MISLQEFHQDFLQTILSDAECRGLMKPQAFFENVCEELIGTGDLSNNYTFAEYIKTGMEAYGYDYDEERKILSILAHQFFQEDSLETLTKAHMKTKFNRLKSFYKKCSEGLYTEMEETSEAYNMAYNIYTYKNTDKINKVRLLILTDGKATRNLSDLKNEELEGINAEFRVIDIEYLYKIYLSEGSNSEFELDLNLPCLEVQTGSKEYKSYLAIVNGDDLADIYEQYGQRLFEQNVRTFLQFRGNVNKGIRNTIEYKPDMFFAYNNGITATATSVELDKNSNIIKLINFQIVNGGQTTSAIYAAKKISRLDVSKVSVQMKLSVVKEKEKQGIFVSNVSEYANTQNKVNKSDFFSNNPFHKEIKNYSKRIWVSAAGGSQRRTHWFYERVRGEYLNEQAYLTHAGKKQFQLENPKQQVLDKTFLSKSENVWLQKPHIVSKGAQYSFAAFAKDITDKLEKDNLSITENYFKDIVARVILFRTLEKMITQSDWYDGGFRAPTVAYTIAYLSYLVDKTGKYLNFSLIWEAQKVPKELAEILKVLSETVYNRITVPPVGSANVAQWCKQAACWDAVKTINTNVVICEKLLVNNQDQKYKKKEDKKEKELVAGIEIQMFVVEKSNEIWKKLYVHYKKYELTSKISRTQLDILHKMSKEDLRPPSEKQSKILYKLYNDAVDEGVVF